MWAILDAIKSILAKLTNVGIDQVTANANEVVTKTGSVTAATLSEETTKKIGVVGNEFAVVDAVIAAEGTTSTEIDFRGYKHLSFLMPSAWTAATLTIQGSATEGGTKRAIKNDEDAAFPDIPVVVDTIYSIDTNVLMIAGIHWLSFSVSAAQTEERTIRVMLKA